MLKVPNANLTGAHHTAARHVYLPNYTRAAPPERHRCTFSTFGILAARFRLFSRPINAKIEHVEPCTKTSIALHSYLMKRKNFENSLYCPDGFTNIDGINWQRQGDWRKIVVRDTGIISVSKIGSNDHSKQAKMVRNLLCNYFSSPAEQVPWQWDVIYARRTYTERNIK